MYLIALEHKARPKIVCVDSTKKFRKIVIGKHIRKTADRYVAGSYDLHRNKNICYHTGKRWVDCGNSDCGILERTGHPASEGQIREVQP